MTREAKNFLQKNNLTVRGISRLSGINASTISYTFKRPISNWKVGIILSLAKILKTTPANILNNFL